MGRYIGPRTKVCRRLGFMIYDNSNVEKAFMKREQEPFRRKQSEYGRRLLEKQKVMFYYGMREGQMRKLFNLARRTKGNTSKAFLIACERRLDNVVYSAGFTASRAQARQLISHGNILVNGRRVDVAQLPCRHRRHHHRLRAPRRPEACQRNRRKEVGLCRSRLDRRRREESYREGRPPPRPGRRAPPGQRAASGRVLQPLTPQLHLECSNATHCAGTAGREARRSCRFPGEVFP